MSNYTDNANSCRVDFFKTTGKWYISEAVIFQDDLYDELNPTRALLKALYRHFFKGGEKAEKPRLCGMTAVCIEPHLQYCVPIIAVVPETQEDFEKEIAPKWPL